MIFSLLLQHIRNQSQAILIDVKAFVVIERHLWIFASFHLDMVGVVDGSCLFQSFERGTLPGLSQLSTASVGLIAVNFLAFENGRAVEECGGEMEE